MNKVQFVNAFTQEVIREEELKDQRIQQFIVDFEKTKKLKGEVLLIDHGLKVYEAKYISHTMYKEEDKKVYRLLFKAKKSHLKVKRT
jgi:hypothetical protein